MMQNRVSEFAFKIFEKNMKINALGLGQHSLGGFRDGMSSRAHLHIFFNI